MACSRDSERMSETASTTGDDLAPQEMARYARHFTLPEFGVDGQKKLKQSRVLIVGAGGLGSPVSLYLAAAGVGGMGIVDFDRVDESNLQRQILYGIDQVGQPKIACATERLQQLNPYVEIETYDVPLTSENALEIVGHYDIVVDGTDNFPTRYLVNDACVLLGKPNVYGSIFRFDGQASVFHYEDGPCYRCLYAEPPPPGLVPSCAEGGVLGVLPGIIGCIQANEAIKVLTGIGESLKGRLLLFDALRMTFQELKLRRDSNCAVCGDRPTVTELIDYKGFCGLPAEDEEGSSDMGYGDATVTELKDLLDQDAAITVIDVREDFEVAIAAIPGTVHIPMNEVPDRLDELDRDADIIVQCKSGGRSAQVAGFLVDNGFSKVRNLVGGILAWSQEIDPSVSTY
jgi:adenylyltransferase/sulfurtransferase